MSDRDEPTIRDARPEDAPAILELLEAAYPRWPPIEVDVPAIEHLRWKLAPPGDPPHHSVVLIGDRIAATQSRWVYRMQIGEEEYIGDSGADLAVHPDFRGLGLSRLIKDRDHERLAAAAATGTGAGGFTMESNAPQVRQMYAPDSITRSLTTWVRPFRLPSYLSVHHRTGGARQLLTAVQQRAVRRTPRSTIAGRIEVLDNFDERSDALWASARRTFDIIAFRDASYLNWRFADQLSGKPVILGWVDGDRLLAYAVVRRAGDQGDLMDWLWAPEAEPALPALVQAAIAELQTSGASNVTCWLPENHRAEPVLRAAGFAAAGTQTVLLDSREHPESPPAALAVLDDPTRTVHLTISDFDFM